MDTNRDGVINSDEILQSKIIINIALHNLGYRDKTQDDVDKLIAEIDLNKNNLVEFSEFLKVRYLLSSDDERLLKERKSLWLRKNR